MRLRLVYSTMLKKSLFVQLLNFTIVLACISIVKAQTIPFKVVSLDEGLSQSVVQTMAQDKMGYLWIGTEYGLNRYNGKRVDSYYQADGLPSNNITSLSVDNAGVVWIGTDHGIAIWLNESFSIFEGTDSLLKSSVNTIKHDNRGTIWVATEGDGLWSYNGNIFERWNTDNGLSSDSVRDVLPDVEGVMWIATRNGINIFDGNSFEYVSQKEGLSDNKVRSLLLKSDKTIWAGTRNGISIFEHGKHVSSLQKKDGLNEIKIKKLFEDRLKRVWIAAENGVYIWKKGKITQLNTEKSLDSQYFFDVLEDREGSIWLGTFGNGVVQYQGDQFLNWTLEDGLPNNVVSSVFTSLDRTTWVGTFGGGISKISENTAMHTITKRKNGLQDDRVYHINQLRNGQIWIATRDGISVVTESGIIQNSPLIPNDKYRHILETKTGAIWLATEDQGVVILHQNNKVERITTDEGLVSNSTRVLFERSDGAIFIGTTNGLSKYQKGRFTNYTLVNGLLNQVILDITETPDGSIWLAHFLGITQYSPKDEIKHIPLNFRGEPVAAYLIRQFNSYLWIGTNKGLVRYSYLDKNPHAKYYTANMGLVNDELNKGAIDIDKNGIFWLGTVRGLTRFDPMLETEITIKIPIHFDEIEAMGRKRETFRTLELNYDDNLFLATFTPITLLDPNTISYKYRLYDADPSWQITHSNTVRYAGLLDDEYKFKVIAISNDGIESNPIQLNIKVNPPFWKSSWFIFIVISSLSSLFYLVFSTIKTTRQIELERIRVRIASDLHDDVGASLTEMALQADYVQSFNLDDEVREMMAQIGTMSRNVVTTMDDIVWSIDARNDTLGDLTDRIQDYTMQMVSRVGIEPEFNFELTNANQILHADSRQHIYLICKEAINNVVKYSGASLLKISLSKKGSHYDLEIKDNGKGFADSIKKTGHGLKNMKSRAEKLHATFFINGENGCEIQIKGIRI